MKRILLLLLSIGLIPSLCSAARPKALPTPYRVIAVQNGITDTTSLKPGFFYALPRTVLKISIPVIKKETVRGPFSDFAESLLGLKNFVKETVSTYSLGDIQIRTKAEPDPDQLYYVEVYDPDISFHVGPQLILETVNSPKGKFPRQDLRKEKLNPSTKNAQSTGFMLFTDLHVVEEFDTIIQQRKVDTSIIEELIMKPVKVEKTLQQRAEEAVEQIIKLRDERMKLITGFHEVNYEADAMKFMHAELLRQEGEYLKLFTGYTKTTTENQEFEVLPANGKRLSIAAFSPTQGLRGSESEGLQPITISCIAETTGPKLQVFAQRIQSQSGFAYRIPELTRIAVHLGNQVVNYRIFPVSQFGIIQSPPAVKCSLHFDPQSGELLHYDLGE